MHPIFHVPGLSSNAVASRLTHTLGRWVKGPLKVSVQSTPAGLREGRLDTMAATCTGCQIKGVTVHSFALDINHPWINLYCLWDEDRIGLLAFKSAHARR